MAVTAAGCGVNDIYINDGGESPEVPGQINGSMEDYPIRGIVTDAHGLPLSGVTVTSGDQTATTNDAGFFYLESIDVNCNRALVKFSKEGYFPVQRSCETYYNGAWTVAMNADNGEATARTQFSATSGSTLTASGMSVALPSDGYKVVSTGEKYTGTVNASLFYLSPEMDLFSDLMPGGDLAALDDDNEEKCLVSYGMANVLLTDDEGNRLQLADGKKAVVTFPIPASMAADAPSEIPLWAFDETRGLWREQREATRGSDGMYTGEVDHFSWWNIDTDEDKAWIEGYVRNTDGEPLPGITVKLNQKDVNTDSDGHYRAPIQSGCTFDVRVPSESYGNYKPEFKTKAGPAASLETITLDITLPTLRYIYGDVVDQNDNPLVAAYEIAYPGSTLRWNNTDDYGHFRYYLPLGFSGDVVISAMSATAAESDITVNVPQDENVYQKIVLDVAGGGGGGGNIQPDIIADCGNGEIYYMTAARPLPTTFGGVIIQDSWMTAVSEISEYANYNFVLQLAGYDPSKREYSDFIFMATQGKRSVICQNGGTLNVFEDNGTYYFNLTGDGFYLVEDDEGNFVPKQATITVNNVGITHLMTLERRENYVPSEPFPSFTPVLSTPAPVAMVITKSEKLGTGGILYYNGGKADFDNLAGQADRSGLERIIYGTDSEGYADAGYRNDISSIMIEYDPFAETITSDSWRDYPVFDMLGESGDEESYFSRLTVTSLSGGTLYFFNLGSDSNSELYPSRKAKVMRRKLPLIRGKRKTYQAGLWLPRAIPRLLFTISSCI